jgi:hypothetical protein
VNSLGFLRRRPLDVGLGLVSVRVESHYETPANGK